MPILGTSYLFLGIRILHSYTTFLMHPFLCIHIPNTTHLPPEASVAPPTPLPPPAVIALLLSLRNPATDQAPTPAELLLLLRSHTFAAGLQLAFAWVRCRSDCPAAAGSEGMLVCARFRNRCHAAAAEDDDDAVDAVDGDTETDDAL